MIHHGDCLEVMAGMPDASVDAVVTDPPYGLSFMGKAWDHGVPAGPFWAEMLRVAKPGAYLLAFGGTRTVHRIATNIEDAGWIIRDMLMWIYASGFPKGKANLKPAWEPIVMARKPGPLHALAIDTCRIAMSADDPTREWGERYGGGQKRSDGEHYEGTKVYGSDIGEVTGTVHAAGRWPSNVLLSDPELFDESNPWVVGSGATDAGSKGSVGRVGMRRDDDGFAMDSDGIERGYGDSGGYSRFFRIPSHYNDPVMSAEPGKYPSAFIIPKADRADREPIVRGLAEQQAYTHNSDGRDMSNPKNSMGGGERKRVERGETAMKPRANTHPTVKPTDLMRHLVRLVTPPGGTVLDPFLGSGTTAIACELEGFPWIGIEKEAEYVAIAEARLNGVQRGLGLDVPAPTKAPPKTHPDLSKHQPKRRAPAENWTGGWVGTEEPDAA